MAELVIEATIAQGIYTEKATYSGAHNALSGTVGTYASFGIGNSFYAYMSYIVGRGFLSLGTSALGASVISAATLSLYRAGFPCFPNGTLLHTPKGATNIENIEDGDIVWSLNLLTNRLEEQPVTKVIRSVQSDIIRITTKQGLVECTPAHPFMVPGKGWVRAAALKVGDHLVSKAGELVKIITLDLMTATRAVQDLIVNANHNYFVGREMLLVHNKTEHDEGHATLHVVEGVHGDTLVGSDFGDLKAKTTSGGSITDAEIGYGWNDITLNAIGRGWISKTGITKLGLRVAGDIDNLTPTDINYHTIYGEGSGLLPYLTIIYAPAPLIISRAHALSREEL